VVSCQWSLRPARARFSSSIQSLPGWRPPGPDAHTRTPTRVLQLTC
jgi:hypothetical protein